MYLKKIKIEGYRTFNKFELDLNEHLNIIVGDNETGKSTLLEAINLVLSCQIDGRNIQYELNPHVFNSDMVNTYFLALKNGRHLSPPKILIEVYLHDDRSSRLAKLKGTNNTEGEDCPGLYLKVELNEDFADNLKLYINTPGIPNLIPVEYYSVAWRSFADNSVTRNLPFRATIIDTSFNRGYLGPNKYLSRIIHECLDENQQRSLSMAYRKLKNAFINEPGIKDINSFLQVKKGDVTDKTLTVSMDMSARSTWDTSITAHLDEIPFDSVGKGEQCRVQMKLAIEAACDSSVILIEEPENHLSYSNMSRLIEDIAQRCKDRQVVLTTHSSFVLNKLGIDNVKLLSLFGGTLTLNDLSQDTKEYFMKLPGYNTLRLILSARTILVEGPSDELVVQKAYYTKHGKLPIADGIDVISVGSLAFKRFLEIGRLLKLDVHVVLDNDRDVTALKNKYADFLDGKENKLKIFYDSDEACPTLEPQLMKVNSLTLMNEVLGTSFKNSVDILNYMGKNKTESALKIFNTDKRIEFPKYIHDAVSE
jgi:putative ATP-dependent endonuclease of the OLD family